MNNALFQPVDSVLYWESCCWDCKAWLLRLVYFNLRSRARTRFRDCPLTSKILGIKDIFIDKKHHKMDKIKWKILCPYKQSVHERPIYRSVGCHLKKANIQICFRTKYWSVLGHKYACLGNEVVDSSALGYNLLKFKMFNAQIFLPNTMRTHLSRISCMNCFDQAKLYKLQHLHISELCNITYVNLWQSGNSKKASNWGFKVQTI